MEKNHRQGLISLIKIQFKVKPGEIEASDPKLIKSFGLEEIDAQNLMIK